MVRFLVFFSVLSLIFSGCGSSTTGPGDTGTTTDTGVDISTDTTPPDTATTDAQDDNGPADATDTADDAGSSTDNGQVEDTGSAEDNGQAEDTGPSEDTAQSTDTGSPDSGSNNDATDTSQAVDAGPPPVGSADWMTVFGGAGHEEIRGVTADSQGNVYVTGLYREQFTVGTETFTATEPGTNTADAFVVSFNASGDFRWAHAFGAPGADTAFEVSVDGSDNVYVAGSHHSDLTIGTELLESKGSTDIFVVSYDAEGNQLWAKNWGGPYGESPRDLAVNPAGDIFITGSFTGSIVADDVTATTGVVNGLSEVFVLAIDGVSHDALWVQAFRGHDHDVGTSLVADDTRSTVTAVSYYGILTVDEEQGIVFDGGADFNVGLIRLDQHGNVMWAQEFGGSGSEEILGMGMDDWGTVYITGVFSEVANFGGPDLVGTSGHDVMLAAYNSGGVHLWSRAFTGEGTDQGLDLEVGDNGIYVAGRFRTNLQFGDIELHSSSDSYDIFVAGFSSADGTPFWAESVGSTDDDIGAGIGLGGDGGIYVGGYIKADATFADLLYPVTGSGLDAYIFRYEEE